MSNKEREINRINDLRATIDVLRAEVRHQQSNAAQQYRRAVKAEEGIERLKALSDSVPILSNNHVDWLSDIIELVNEVAS